MILESSGVHNYAAASCENPSVDETYRMRSQRINDAGFFRTASPPATQLTRPLCQWPDDMGRKLGSRSAYKTRPRASFKDTDSACVWVDSMTAVPLSLIPPSCPEIDHSATKNVGIELLASGAGRRNRPLSPPLDRSIWQSASAWLSTSSHSCG